MRQLGQAIVWVVNTTIPPDALWPPLMTPGEEPIGFYGFARNQMFLFNQAVEEDRVPEWHRLRPGDRILLISSDCYEEVSLTIAVPRQDK